MNDPISDLFNRLRNAGRAGHAKVDMPHSDFKERVCRLLEREGFLSEIQVTDLENRRRMRVYLRRDDDGKSVIQRIERVSRPGRRLYVKSRRVPRVLRGLGVGIYSTPRGVLSDRECREQRIGGEYVGRVW